MQRYDYFVHYWSCATKKNYNFFVLPLTFKNNFPDEQIQLPSGGKNFFHGREKYFPREEAEKSPCKMQGHDVVAWGGRESFPDVPFVVLFLRQHVTVHSGILAHRADANQRLRVYLDCRCLWCNILFHCSLRFNVISTLSFHLRCRYPWWPCSHAVRRGCTPLHRHPWPFLPSP